MNKVSNKICIFQRDLCFFHGPIICMMSCFWKKSVIIFVLTWSSGYNGSIWTKSKFAWQLQVWIQNTKLHWNLFSSSEDEPFRQTNKLFCILSFHALRALEVKIMTWSWELLLLHGNTSCHHGLKPACSVDCFLCSIVLMYVRTGCPGLSSTGCLCCFWPSSVRSCCSRWECFSTPTSCSSSCLSCCTASPSSCLVSCSPPSSTRHG